MKLSNNTKQPVHGYDLYKSGNSNPAGTIIWSAGEAVPMGYLLCDGTAVGRGNYPDLFAVIGTTFGEGDGSTTFNLPNLINKFIQGSDSAGVEKEAGLPNITGDIVSGVMHVNKGNIGALSGTNSANNRNNVSFYDSGSANFANEIHLDASQSNAIYGNSDTVQPPAVTALPCIKAYNETSVGITVGVVESWHNDDYTRWYRVYSDNWCEQGGFIAATANDQQNVRVTFIKPYIHSPFIQGQNYILQTATNSWTFICYISGLGNVSNTGFGCSIGRTGNSGQGLVWKAEGYIA